MKTLKKVKVFDFRNPNIKILNDKEEVYEMFNEGLIPIVEHITTEDGDCIPTNNQKLMGIVVPNTALLEHDEIFADVCVLDDIQGEFVNYEIDGDKLDDGFMISNIGSVEIK